VAVSLFRGINAVNLDTKGRFAMPTRYRDDLQAHAAGKLVVTIDTDERCLLLYPLPDWEIIERKIEALPSFNKTARRIQRLLIGHATELELDSQGRLLIPPLLREYADIQKRIMLVGQGKKFECWNEVHWTDNRATWLDAKACTEGDMPDELRMISL
jgi:MraZ protein